MGTAMALADVRVVRVARGMSWESNEVLQRENVSNPCKLSRIAMALLYYPISGPAKNGQP